MERLVVYSRPWEKLSWEDVAEEYSGCKLPFKEYVHHLIRRAEGEMALTREEWQLCPLDLPRSAELWDSQYCTSQGNYEALRKLRIVDDGNGNRVVAAPGKGNRGWKSHEQCRPSATKCMYSERVSRALTSPNS
jgi:hypothetical protein